MSKKYDIIVKQAKDALENSYSPYSKFRVGACAVDIGDNGFLGVNIENASYGATICAERSAMFSGISNGSKKFKTIAIISDSEAFTLPCGICRQVMTELCIEDADIICANKDGKYTVYKINELFPHKFEL